MSDIEAKVDTMKQEIDTLQIAFMRTNQPWYRAPSTIISVVSLLFSFGTTAVSYYKSSQDDVRAARTELRNILQRLTTIPKENFELVKKYQGDVDGQALSGLFSQENSLLVRQASEIVDRFPNDVSAGEYFSVAMALLAAADVAKIPVYLDRALSQTADPNVKVSVLRNYGLFLISTGKTSEGRKKYEEALSIWVSYPSVFKYFKDSTDALTEIYWAQAEFGAANIEAAKEHIRKAQDRVGMLTPGPTTTQLQAQAQSTRSAIERGDTLNPVPMPSLGK